MRNSSYRSYKINFLVVILTVSSFIFGACTTLSSGSGSAGGAAIYDTGVNVTTFAGSSNGYADGLGISARFNYTQDVAMDNAGNIYVTDYLNHRIRKIDSSGDVTTLAGDGTKGFADGQGTSAKFNMPVSITLDKVGNIYVSDYGNHCIRKIDSSGNVTTLAGNGTAGFADGIGTSAKFDLPCGVAVDNAGNVYVSDTKNHRIRKIDSSGNVTTLAGNGTGGFADGQGTSAKFNFPANITIDKAGNLYVADMSNNRIRKIDLTANVTTIAGDGTKGFVDGPGTSARFNWSQGIAIDKAGNIYVADWGNQRIRKIDSKGSVTTLAGDGSKGFADGQGNLAKFSDPVGLTVDNAGNVYVADWGNNRIRKITQGMPIKDDAAADEKPAGVKLGALIGTVGGFEGTDVVVNGKDTIGRQAPIGRSLIVDANGQYIYLQSTFPMQTVVKCKVTSGDRTQIKKGMKVYLKP